MTVCFIACQINAFGQAATNLIKNPGFEAGTVKPEGWTITGPLATMMPVINIDSRMKFSDNQSLKMLSTNPNGHGKVVQTIQVTNGQTYQFSARFMA